MAISEGGGPGGTWLAAITRGFITYAITALLLFALYAFLHPAVTDPVKGEQPSILGEFGAYGIHLGSFLLGLAEVLMHRRGGSLRTLFRKIIR